MINLKTILLNIKLYGGYIVAAIIGIVAFVFMAEDHEKVKKLMDQVQSQTTDYRKQLDDLQKIKDDEATKNAQVEQTYQATIAQITQQHAEAVAQLNDQKRDQIRAIITETNDDPNLMAQRINQLLGIPIVSQPATTTNTTS